MEQTSFRVPRSLSLVVTGGYLLQSWYVAITGIETVQTLRFLDFHLGNSNSFSDTQY